MTKKIALFDIDGVINHAERFSSRYCKDFNLDINLMIPFFTGIFQECLIGKRDLKEELKYVLADWKWERSIDELVDYWLRGEINTDNNVIRTITQLKNSGVKLYAGTNQEKYRAEYMRDKVGMGNYFIKFYSSAEVGFKKPNKEFFEYILNDIKAAPEQIVYWDDDEENVAGAKHVGLVAYQFTNFEKFTEQVKEHFGI